MELATMESARRRQRRVSVTFPERLRSALTARGWVRRPEPRVRFGQRVLPGIGVIGEAERPAAAAFLARAQALRSGQLTHLGATIAFDERIDWFPRGSSVAWQRALHGLDELVAVGIAAATASSADERRAWYELATSVAGDWTRRVTVGHPVAWSVPALARRVRNLLVVQALFGPELRKDLEPRRILLGQLFDQAGALATGLPEHDADGWRIAGANALLLAGRFFDGMEARGWVELGTTTLWGQLREQVREDGGHHSRSPVWQAFVLAEYLTALAALRADNDDVPMWGRKRVKGMADCLARLAHPDGTLPAFDTIDVDDVWSVPELLATAAVVLHEPGFAVAPELPGVWPHLVVGDSGRRTYGGFTRAATVCEPRALRRTGFYVLAGTAGDALVIDGAVRRHHDGWSAFGYELAIGGLPIVTGSAVGRDAPGPIAEHLRSMRAQSVLVPAAPTSAELGAVESRFTVRDGVQYFLGTVDGFVGPGVEMRHRRRIFCVPGRFWIVADELHGQGSFTGESVVHLHPDVVVRADCAGRPVVTLERSARAAATLLVAGVKTLGLAGGMEEPPFGWHGGDDGLWRPAPAVIVRMAGTLPLLTAYALVPRSGGVPGELSLRGDAFELKVSLRLDDVVYELTAVQDEVELVTRPA